MKNVAESIRARLLNLSRSSGEPFNFLLEQYATGRFLWRLSKSEYRNRFVLKGAQLFRVWGANHHRPTRDLDLLGLGDHSNEGLATVLNKVCQRQIDPDQGDGLIWSEVTISPIRDDRNYGGVRARKP